jgi:hypothetical protein
LDVIAEYLCFQMQLVDRITHQMLDQEQRRELITALALRLAGHMQENTEELLGPGDYGKPFIERLNERGVEYSEFGYTEDGPSYPFLRHLGFEIQGVMGDRGENRWVIDQVMDRDGPDVAKRLQRATLDLFE